MDSKSFFGSMVWRHFKEFDDLQDLAVDAILDLCEDDDEKVCSSFPREAEAGVLG